MRSYKAVPFGALTCAVALAAAAFAIRAQRPKPFGSVPYTITWQMTEYYSDGRVIPAYTETRSTYSDGRRRSVIRFPNGTIVERAAETGGEAFVVDGGAGGRRLQSPLQGRLKGDPRRHGKWARTEHLLGQDAEVLSFEVGAQSHELYHAPRLNNDIIRTVYRDNGVTRVLEPLSIVLGEQGN
jgi:hypothetical protein